VCGLKCCAEGSFLLCNVPEVCCCVVLLGLNGLLRAACCRARDALMQLFGVHGGGSRRRYSTVVVLDEVDMLMTRDQAVSGSNRDSLQRQRQQDVCNWASAG